MVERVKKLLEESFQGIDLELHDLRGERITGTAVWSGFAGLDQVDRQDKLRDLLRQKLGPDVVQVGVILTYTPDELHAMQAA